MKLHPSQILRQAIAAWMSPVGSPPAVDILFNFQRGNAPWWFLERLNGCALYSMWSAALGRQTFPCVGRVIANPGFMGFAVPKFSGKLPAAWRRRNRHVVGIAPVWRRGIKNLTPSLKFQNRFFAVTRLFSRCAQCQPFWVSPPREAAREAIAHVLRASRLEPNCPN